MVADFLTQFVFSAWIFVSCEDLVNCRVSLVALGVYFLTDKLPFKAYNTLNV